MTLVELTDADDDKPVVINFDLVQSFFEDTNDKEEPVTIIHMVDGEDYWEVRQTLCQIMDELKA